ncbi:MAG: sulfide/dihydroorotate dehydrogenase-like FAD/NAD-binding protein [Acutalibacteraceae bacterium]|nr:sulfide/dihydroorotate dehydrogenase-like FAD/NAD-binding protein [Acutalibacteraceae bacterium]
MFEILEKKQLNEQVTAMTISAPFVAKKVKPGQFVIIRIDEKGERVPLTVADFDSDKGTLTIIFQAVGFTTKKLATLSKGDFITDCVGPLGQPTEFKAPKKAIVIGGGVGCAIAYPQAKALHNMGVDTTVIAGFRNRDIVILEEEMRNVSDSYFVTTDDGSYGRKGFVTDVLKELIEKDTYDLVIAIGPIPMMKFVSKTTEQQAIRTIVSLNPIMIDGTGMCGGCRVKVGGEVKFACVDGPDFDGHQVDYDELMRRNGLYREEEAHACRLEGVLNG